MVKINKVLELKKWLFEIIFVILNISIVSLFYRNILLTTILISCFAIFALIRWKSRRTIAIFFLGALVGAIAEMICIKFGVWDYKVTNFYNIPFWLFILWGSTASTIYQIARKIKERKLK